MPLPISIRFKWNEPPRGDGTDGGGGAEGVAATPNPDNIGPESPTRCLLEKAGLSTNVGSAPVFGGQSAGTDARGTPSVITLGKN